MIMGHPLIYIKQDKASEHSEIEPLGSTETESLIPP